jgi:hypothetical protein
MEKPVRFHHNLATAICLALQQLTKMLTRIVLLKCASLANSHLPYHIYFEHRSNAAGSNKVVGHWYKGFIVQCKMAQEKQELKCLEQFPDPEASKL